MIYRMRFVANVPDLLESQQAWDNKYLTRFKLHTGEEMVEAATPVKFGGVTEPPRKTLRIWASRVRKFLQSLDMEKKRLTNGWRKAS